MHRLPRFVKLTAATLGVFIVLFGLVQIIPYGRTHANPPTKLEPRWDSERTRELAVRACFDCHSNQTKWPWYANVAPVSWVVMLDVNNAREIVNFSEWNTTYPLALYSGKRTREGNMPPYKYAIAHPEAQLTAEEREFLARGLERTLGTPDDATGYEPPPPQE